MPVLQNGANFATIVYAVLTAAMVLILWRQLGEIKKADRGRTYYEVLKDLQNEPIRAARRTVFELKDVSFDKWNDEQKQAGEQVCSSYDVVGMLVRHGFVGEDLVIESWGDSLRRLWPILEPLVESRRKRNSPAFWDDFQYLARRATRLQPRRRRLLLRAIYAIWRSTFRRQQSVGRASRRRSSSHNRV